MRYAWARYRESRHMLAYRIYVSDCLRILTQNTAYQLALTPRQDGAEIPTVFVNTRFYDPQTVCEDTADDGADIIAEVLQSLGLG